MKMLGLWSTTLHARPDERTSDTLRRAPEGISIGGDLCRTRGSLFPIPAHGLGRVSAARVILWAHAGGDTRMRGRSSRVAEIQSGVYTGGTMSFLGAIVYGLALKSPGDRVVAGPVGRSEARSGVSRAARLGQLLAAFFLSRGGDGERKRTEAVRVRRKQERSVLARHRLAAPVLASTRMPVYLCTPVRVERMPNHV